MELERNGEGKIINDRRTAAEKICFRQEGNRLVYEYDNETLWIEAWGENAVRVRATKEYEMPQEDWALSIPQPNAKSAIVIAEDGSASLQNGKITVRCSAKGWLSFYNQKGERILHEYQRNRRDLESPYCSALERDAREFQPKLGGDYALTMRFESLSAEEKLYGMGQYQQSHLNLKGNDLELAHRNSQASVPFVLSSLGYGFLWNNPALGRAVFGCNVTSWEAKVTKALDYWVTAGDTPAEIEEAYACATGTVPMMPDYATGFWQCKLRYQTQEELLEVAREYKRRKLPISVIVIDYFHWPLQGEWKLDPTYWPDPDAMIAELKEMDIELMISVWPTVDKRCENYEEMKQKGLLVRTDRGARVEMECEGNTLHYDATNPKARDYVWQKAKQNYYDKGIKLFWLDEAEPEYAVYSYDIYRYARGTHLEVGNIYPRDYAKTFYDGQQAAGQENIINLIRCAWAGSQKYGALVWSGDIHSDFETLRNQYAAGLHMGLAGIPWWTTDIGGFHGGVAADPAFHELLIRWFEYGAFCPVMRLHGSREPHKPQFGTTGGATCLSGADNEVWSYSPEVEEICSKYLFVRERLRPYIAQQMQAAHKKGTPVIRPLFYDFPEDAMCWEDNEEYMFGGDVLVAPVMYAQTFTRTLYLPKGHVWTHVWSGAVYQGGQEITVDAPLAEIPVFTEDDVSLPIA